MKKNQSYQAPIIMVHQLLPELRVLEAFSAELNIEEMQDGGEY